MTAEASTDRTALRLVLAAGIPGTKTPEAVAELMRWMKSQGRPEHSRWVAAPKFETFLLAGPHKKFTDLLKEPKPILRREWLLALTRTREHLDQLAKTRVNTAILPIHLVWYHQDLREYISVLDTVELRDRLAPHRVVHVLCLIDDIHDVYSRLRGPGQLYDRQARRLSSAEAKRGHAFMQHLRILDWRSREIVAAESIAHRLSCPLTVLATKHHPNVAYQALLGKDQIYLSHPITEVRRLEKSGREENHRLARELKEDLWNFQQVLVEGDYPLLQPTCIDEYRLAERAGRVILKERFYPLERYTESLFCFDGTGHEVVYPHLNPEDLDTIDERDTVVARDLARTTREFIENQVTSRDLQMVTQAKHLIVYRPRFNGNMANGVLKEIFYFNRLKELDEEKGRIILIDSRKDRDVFAARRFLEEMIRASTTGRWNIQLSEADVVDYLLDIRPETHELIHNAALSDSLEETRWAVNQVLRDIGRSDNWSLGEHIETKPLGTEGTYTEEQQDIETFLDKLQKALRPFEEQRPYRGCPVIWMDGKNSQELRDEIRSILGR